MSERSESVKEFNGLPYRGKTVPLLKNEDGPERQPTLKSECHARQFNMSIDADVQELSQVWTLASAEVPRATIALHKEVYDASKKAFIVLLVWGEPYYDDPVISTENAPVQVG